MSIQYEAESAGARPALGIIQVISDAFDLTIYNYIWIFCLNVPVVLAQALLFGPRFFEAPVDFGEFSNDPESLQKSLGGNYLFWADIVAATLTLVVSCGVVRLLHDRFNRSPNSSADSIVAGFKRAPYALGVFAIWFAAFLVAGLAFAFVASIFSAIFGAFGVVLAFAASAVCFFWMIQYLFSYVACVLDGAGPISAFQISWRLTEGYRWPLLWLCVVSGFFMAIAGLVIGGAMWALTWVLPVAAVAILTNLAFVPLFSGWGNGVPVMAYNRLKLLKGGAVSQ